MSEAESIYIPIPHFPPFKLRSSMIDKDPVIWAHLLEAYIKLIQLMLDPQSPKLSVKSQQQLQLFLKVYLKETSVEGDRIFSLGSINPDIKRNTETLRSYVFQLIKNFSFVKLNMTGEMIWDFVRIYSEKNAQTVRGLIDGSFKSKFNDNKKSGSISSIQVLQKHLEKLISEGKFTSNDMTCFTILLGQHVSKTTYSMGSSKTVNKSQNNSLQFAESFVSSQWVEFLDLAYADGQSTNAEAIKDVMVLSIVSLSAPKLAKLASELGISSVDTLNIAPLYGAVITSEALKDLIPKLEERLPFLKFINKDIDNDYDYEDENGDYEENIEEISLLVDLFPHLTEKKAKIVLKEHNGDVEYVTNLLLENPDRINSIEDCSPPPQIKKGENLKLSIQKRSIYDEDDISKGDFSKASIVFGKKKKERPGLANDDLKKKTLNAALRLMYESDEDEPDDTYDDQEKTTGSELEDDSKRKKGAKTTSPPDEKGTAFSAVDQTERYLFSFFKKQGSDSFAKTSRKSSNRQQIKKNTNWSDEQIEGWLRMLLKSPRRYKILEEDYFYGGGNPNRQQKIEPVSEGKEGPSSKSPTPDTNQQSKEQVKRTHARNEKNKASKSNHNRKSRHDKKSNLQLVGMKSV
ncbi:hypothetical protein CANMA_001532 [Candida margitis]|uniref:uncharacterized protein n=1 Tax=Candida margitis TaxID=1775924 RepID=UPI0022275B6F|nr:uncharacterized protein CANMA_001532 [Candida margitis]KAI5969464.1 hypothetical protein CANMA_001532 [Candida margitis]